MLLDKVMPISLDSLFKVECIIWLSALLYHDYLCIFFLDVSCLLKNESWKLHVALSLS